VTRLPLISIVTPTLNQGRFIEQTLRSIERQTYRNFEHIVVDGGSTDETLDILRRHEGGYPMRWTSQPDAGMYDAINKGMAEASGDILAYLNSDDLYFPWTLEIIVAQFKQHPDADFVFGDALAIDDETGQQDVYWMPPFDLEDIRGMGFLAQPAVFWRRSVLDEEGPFDTSLRYVADCDFWMRAGSRQRFHKANEFLAVERKHAGTLRESTDGAAWAELATVRARYQGPSTWGRRRLALRRRIWFRLFWLRLLTQSITPARWRLKPWSRFLGAGQSRISRSRVFLMLLPSVGRGQPGRVLTPSRYWLEPRSNE
jgi:glycosyltransferase involved in cell wall biosynthesis